MALQGQRVIHSVRKYCLFYFALYVVTPDQAIQTRTVRQHSVLRVATNIVAYLPLTSFSSQTAVALLRESCTFVKRQSYVFLDQPDRAHLKEKQRLMTITSEIIKMLFTGSARSRRPQFITVHKSNGYNHNSITTTVNCLKKDLPNL